jgi:hypothetical protein
VVVKLMPYAFAAAVGCKGNKPRFEEFMHKIKYTLDGVPEDSRGYYTWIVNRMLELGRFYQPSSF